MSKSWLQYLPNPEKKTRCVFCASPVEPSADYIQDWDNYPLTDKINWCRECFIFMFPEGYKPGNELPDFMIPLYDTSGRRLNPTAKYWSAYFNPDIDFVPLSSPTSF
jgi:hypothetical protein